ncbi:cyclase family protein [Nocardia sp. CC227C]|uniref:cyclase family protein n=1 Tax=Nocardia sp. CC227C TaxID=3044562 RepID=UPI00278C4D7D|nr:cyclase family protein [Nocardia sp. CC227C]
MNLSHVHDPARTPLFPGDPAFTVETVVTVATDGYLLRYVRQAEHTGTHWGAPVHFDPEGLAADELDTADLLLPAVKIDVRERCAADRDYAVGVGDLMVWEKRHGRIPDQAAVIAWTGKLLYREHRISLECLANLSELPTTGAWVLAGGPIYRGGSGAPATIFGILPQ